MSGDEQLTGPAGWRSLVPGIALVTSYQRKWLAKDVVAGLVLSALLVPQGMAYAELAGLPPITGLYTSILCLTSYAIFGPSRILVLGPDSSLGPMIAATMTLTMEPGNFASGRHFAAWLGLTPREHSTGGKQRMGKISKAGNERLRSLLVVGAMSVIRFAKPGSKSASPWLLQLLERKPRKLAAVALANKMARVVWAMMATGEAYRGSKGAAAAA